MNHFPLIEKYYRMAVADITEEMLKSSGDEWYEYIVNLPELPKLTYVLMVLNQQVLNGGFHQYFSNTYGQFAPETVIALQTIGAHENAVLLQKAYSLVNSENMNAISFRKNLRAFNIPCLYKTDELYAPFNALDDLYYNNNEEIAEMLEKYLQENNG